jgi:methionine-S-sulfoxide reductase
MRMIALFGSLFIISFIGIALFYPAKTSRAISTSDNKGDDLMSQKPQNYPIAIFAGGCFWCVESEFRALDGVLFTRSGYIGGHLDNPKYEDTHDSKSGHAEAVEITYDPAKISYTQLLEHFLIKAHDPTQLNRQGPDTGTQYRSAIFYANDAEKKIAADLITDINTRKVYAAPIVTTLEPATTFWEAEAYHQQYYEKYEEKNGQPHVNDWLKRQKRKP